MSIDPEPGADTYNTSRAIGAKPPWKCCVDVTAGAGGRIGSIGESGGCGAWRRSCRADDTKAAGAARHGLADVS
jgi:hypothetical protein